MYVGSSECDADRFTQEIFIGRPARTDVGEVIVTETPFATALALESDDSQSAKAGDDAQARRTVKIPVSPSLNVNILGQGEPLVQRGEGEPTVESRGFTIRACCVVNSSMVQSKRMISCWLS
jgi:hypothetical protein